MVLNLSSTESTGSGEAAASSRPKTPNPKAPKAAQDVEDHIAKLDLRVGIIRSVANHPDAESLYIEQGWLMFSTSYQSNMDDLQGLANSLSFSSV